MGRLQTLVSLAIVSFCFLLAYTFTFDLKINLGGDNLSYYYLGKALNLGQGYSNISSPQVSPHTHFPPGYPVIISGALIFFDGITPIKFLNGFFGLGALIIGFLVVRKFLDSDWTSLLLIIFISLNRHILEYSSIMMSEIPFLFFLMLGIWLYIGLNHNKPWFKNGRFIILMVAAIAVFYIRSFGIILIMAILFDLLIKRNIVYASIFLAGIVLLVAPWSVRNSLLSGSSGYVTQLLMINPYDPSLGGLGMGSLLERVSNNVLRYCDKEIVFLLTNFSEIDYQREASHGNILCSLVLLVFLFVGLSAKNKNREFFVALCALAAGILVLWPSEWFGVRFMLPMLILILGFIFKGIQITLGKISSGTLALKSSIVVLLLMCLGQMPAVMALNDKSNQDYPEGYQDYFLASAWIKENTDEGSVVVCRKPMLSYHFSQRPSVKWLNASDQNEIIKSFTDNNVDYVIVDVLGYKSTREKILPLFRVYPEKLSITKRMERTPTVIGKFTSYLGYTGSMIDGKKEGFGIYIWQNGNSYKGQWKNDLRHGRGILKLATSGKEIHGIWENNVLVSISNK